jgi:crotonobetainyl-CoA hydratase
MSGGIPNLLRQIPHHLAMGVLLTGRLLSAEEWHRLGLVNELAEPGQLDDVVGRWLDAILACSPISIRAIKQVATQTRHLSPRDAFNLRLPALVAAMASDEHEEGVAAFLEKRPPSWAS